jgi:hypothetical protein
MRTTRLRIIVLAACVAAFSSLGCSDLTTAYPLGKLAARVVDANGAAVQGVFADLYKLTLSGPVRWRASTTSSDGIAVFGAGDGGVIAGDYFIRLSFITGHQLAPGETNDRAVTVAEGDDIIVTFQVVATGPGPVS